MKIKGLAKNSLKVAIGAIFALSLSSCATNTELLETAVESRTEKEKARDQYRNPYDTLAFFQIEPGMKVAEVLPGGGWYTKIIANSLGSNGAIYGVNYDDDMWSLFGFPAERAKTFKERTAKFGGMVAEATNNGIKAQGITFSNAPDSINGTLDRVLFIRALHNLNRFEESDRKSTMAIAAARKWLKKGGLVGVVQHRAPESASAESVKGQRGYLKQSDVIAMFEKAGFTLVSTSEINANSNDNPGEKAVVWRLPPTLSGSKDKPALRAEMQAIGESDRMTLLFRKR